jgi:hypothetical protein
MAGLLAKTVVFGKKNMKVKKITNFSNKTSCKYLKKISEGAFLAFLNALKKLTCAKYW